MAGGLKIKKEVSANTLLWIGGGILGYTFVLKPLFDTFGVTDSKEDKQNAASEKNNQGWQPAFWLQTQQKKIPALYTTYAAADGIAKAINGALGGNHLPSGVMEWLFPGYAFINDREEVIYAAFRKLQTRVQLSQVSASYENTYKKDLFQELKSSLNDKELNTVVKIADALPVYKK